jgi:hypothetical protein
VTRTLLPRQSVILARTRLPLFADRGGSQKASQWTSVRRLSTVRSRKGFKSDDLLLGEQRSTHAQQTVKTAISQVSRNEVWNSQITSRFGKAPTRENPTNFLATTMSTPRDASQMTSNSKTRLNAGINHNISVSGRGIIQPPTGGIIEPQAVGPIAAAPRSAAPPTRSFGSRIYTGNSSSNLGDRMLASAMFRWQKFENKGSTMGIRDRRAPISKEGADTNRINQIGRNKGSSKSASTAQEVSASIAMRLSSRNVSNGSLPANTASSDSSIASGIGSGRPLNDLTNDAPSSSIQSAGNVGELWLDTLPLRDWFNSFLSDGVGRTLRSLGAH